jgi:Fe-S-cluster containining protein
VNKNKRRDVRRLSVVQDAVARAHRELDAVIAGVTEGDRPACSAGCSYCCHVHVDATRAEVTAIADYLAHADVSSLIETLRERAEMTHDERWAARIPCALLGGDSRCTVYEVRPLRCRSFHSCSADVCREAFTGPVEPDPVMNVALERACDDTEQAFEMALVELGVSVVPVLLEEGLLEALYAQRSIPGR